MKKTILLLFALVNTLITNAQVPTNGLVSFYPFTGNAGDSAGLNNGTVTGATLTTDRFGKSNSAYNFNASLSNYITIPATPFKNANYTFSLWINANTLPANGTNNVIFSIGGSGGDQGISMNNNYLNYNGVASYSSGATAIATQGKVLTTSKWYHIVSVRDSNYLRTYVDGKLTGVSQSSNGALPAYGTSTVAKIGARYNQTINFDGKIDEVRIYNRALDSNEVKSLYNLNFCYQTIVDTTHITVLDTTHITVLDTTNVSVFDTTYVTITDTTHISVTDTLIINALLLGVNPPNNVNKMKLYPNPTKDYLFIHNGDFALMSNYKLKIVNALGQEVFNSNINKQLFDINLSKLSGKGIYFVMLYDPLNNLMEVKKIILQ